MTIEQARARVQRARRAVEKASEKGHEHVDRCHDCNRGHTTMGGGMLLCKRGLSLYLKAWVTQGRRKEAEAVLREVRRG